MIWTCIGFITYLTLASGFGHPNKTIIIGSYASESRCMQVGEAWQKKYQWPGLYADYTCERMTTIGDKQ